MAATQKNWIDNSPPQVNDVDLNGFKEENNNLIVSAGIGLSIADHTQTSKAIAEYSAHGDFYTDTGAANAYVLSAQGSKYPPVGYEDGMRVRFRPANTNTGSKTITVNVSGLGAKNIRKGLASAAFLVEGDLIAGKVVELVYNSGVDVFDVQIAEHPHTGDVRVGYASGDLGWVKMRDASIGSAASGATERANDDTELLFTRLWTRVSDTYAPVSGGRGASAQEDFDADKTLTLPRTLGRALSCAGAGSGLTSRATGLYTGSETHVLSTAELASHRHTVNATSVGGNQASPLSHYPARDDSGKPWDATPNGTMNSSMINTTGGGNAHTNMQPSTFMIFEIKL